MTGFVTKSTPGHWFSPYHDRRVDLGDPRGPTSYDRRNPPSIATMTPTTTNTPPAARVRFSH